MSLPLTFRIEGRIMKRKKVKQKEVRKILLTDVRVAYPSIFQKEKFGDEDQKYSGTFLIPKSNKTLKKKLDKEIKRKLEENGIDYELESHQICLKDGDKGGKQYTKGHWTIKASHDQKPKVLDRRKEEVFEGDIEINSGDYVQAIISLWFQDNQYGVKVNANLHGIMFCKSGEYIGGGSQVDVEADDYDDLEDSDIDIEDDYDDDDYDDDDDDDI